MSVGAYALAALLACTLTASARVSSTVAYEEFRRNYGVTREYDVLSFKERLALFEKHLEIVRRHNAQPGISWVAGMNRFADYTDEEFKALLGHRPHRSGGSEGAAVQVSSFLEVKPRKAVALTVDWRSKLHSSSQVKDQGACGSCWAVAAVGALESHAEMSKPSQTRPLSFEQLVDCVENPDECGGQGGCRGATAELAFEWVRNHGLVAEADYKGYISGGDGSCKTSAQASIKTGGFTRLPENKLEPLMEAIATKGPVVVSVDAGNWNIYKSGIFDSCSRDAAVNHAVLLVGYGNDEALKKDYWLVRNSWSSRWGEDGYIRVLRHSKDEGADGYCGIDSKPLDGVGCKKGPHKAPEKIPVCGMCGILSDSAFPIDVHSSV